MKTIWKYELKPSPEIQEIKLPPCSKFLSVVEQNMKIQLYVSIDYPEAAGTLTHRYMVIGTGWVMNFGDYDFPKFMGTVVQGPYVWHVFELEDLPF